MLCKKSNSANVKWIDIGVRCCYTVIRENVAKIAVLYACSVYGIYIAGMETRMNKTRKRCILFLLFFCVFLGMVRSNHSSAAGSYMIKVNKQANCVTIYQKDDTGDYKAIKALVCSTGYATKTGTYSLKEKYRWHELDGPCYGQYCTRIYEGVLFHSVWYHNNMDPSSLSVSSYNKLGTTASHGCVRLTCEGAKWIYDNIPSGTTVVVYNSSDPGPLGKPEAIKLSGYRGYDPTDIWTSSNPWNNKKPSITLKSNVKKSLDFASDFDVRKTYTAKNTTGFDATARVKITVTFNGAKIKKVDTKIPGTYTVTYKLTDEIGRKASKVVTFKVKAAKKKPVIKGSTTLYLKSKDQMTKNKILQQLTVKQGKKQLDKKYITVTFTKKGKYYQAKVKAQNASYPTTFTMKVYIDKSKPKFVGITHKEIRYVEQGRLVDKEFCLEGVSVTDNLSKLSKDDIKVTVQVNEDQSGYTVLYEVADAAGNKAKITVYYLFGEPGVTPGPGEAEPATPPAVG